MKRLQFRHNNEVFQNRTDALKYFADIVDTTKTASTIFQSSLYAEPLVAKYLDEDGNQQVILAIGVDSGLTPYHIIDSKEIAERLDTNKEAIESEVKRAKAAEMALSGSIETEIARAIEAERVLSGAVDTERDERIAADAVLQTQITENTAKIVPVTENLGANIREEYALKNAKGEELGSHIKVYKDSALVGAEINYKGATAVSQKEDGTFEFTYGADMDREAEYLYLIYRNENGGLSLVALDFENFLMESEEGFGIKIVEHKIAINIKDNEKYLKVSENGLQTINIDEAIKDATDKLNAKLDEEINTEREERIEKDEDILTEIGAIKEFNTGLDKKIDVEITRSTKEDANFKTQMEHLALDLTNEISNREGANTSIRAEFAAGDTALGSRIDTEAEIRSSADNALSERIDNEAKIRGAEDTSLTSAINGVRERLKAVEADYLVSQDKADVLLAVSGAHNTAIEAVNAAASAQTTANEAKTKIEGFLAAAEIGGAAVDTLIEIQNYIKSDNTAASEMLAAIAENKSDIAAESERAKGAEKTLDDKIKAETSARVESANILSGALSTEITRATGAESVNAASIANEVTRATNVESSLQTALTTEISNRELADNAIRRDFATADTALGNRIAAEELARQTAYNALNTKIDNEATTRSTEIQRVDASIASLLSSISGETQDRKNEDTIINGKLVALSGNVLTEINKTKTEAINESFGRSSAYTDTEIAKAIQGINNKKVNDVSYDNGNKKIYLTFADGTVSAGFDASEFVVDGMLNEVKFDENTNEITFKWNTTAGITDVIVPLNKFVDQYRVSTDSASYLKISENNEISAIVDNGDGFSNTLATTTFVTTSVNGAYNKINVVSGSVETINNSVKELSGSVKSSIDKIAILNADKKTEGSVLYKIDNEFEKSLITDGVPVTAVSPEDANKVHSLIRQITVNGEMRYYAMSDATEMFYVKPRTSETAPIEAVNLNDYITGLETRIAALEERLSGFEGNIEQTMKNLIKSYLVGTENEIKIAEADNKLKIGFDDNAIFGEI